MKSPQQSLKDWTAQKWTTKSGKPSSKTGERYLPEKAIKALSPSEYAATTRAKRAGKAAGKQFVAQPKKIAQKTAGYRKNGGRVKRMAEGGDPLGASLDVTPTYFYSDKDRGITSAGANVRGRLPVSDKARLSMDASPSITSIGGKTSTSAGKRRYSAEYDLDADRSVGAVFEKGPRAMGSFGGAPFSGGVAPDKYVGFSYRQRFAKGGKPREK